MSIKIRLRRMGRKKQAHYRIVVADTDSPRDGRFVESLGYYRPLSHPARVVVDMERVDHWLDQGAIPSDTVASILKKARKGGDESMAVGEADKEAERKAAQEALAAKRKAEAEALAAEEAEAEAAKAGKKAEKKAAAEKPAEAADEEAAEEKAAEEESSEGEAQPEAKEAEADEKPAAEAKEVEAEEKPAAEADESAEAQDEEKKSE